MLRKITLPLLLLVPIGCKEARDESLEGAKAVQGTWDFSALDEKGVKAADAVLKKMSVTVTNDKFQMLVNNDVNDEFVIRVNAAKTPAEIDFVYLAGPNQGAAVKGIFVLDGRTLKICTADVGKTRPTEFAAQAGTTLMVLKKRD